MKPKLVMALFTIIFVTGSYFIPISAIDEKAVQQYGFIESQVTEDLTTDCSTLNDEEKDDVSLNSEEKQEDLHTNDMMQGIDEDTERYQEKTMNKVPFKNEEIENECSRETSKLTKEEKKIEENSLSKDFYSEGKHQQKEQIMKESSIDKTDNKEKPSKEQSKATEQMEDHYETNIKKGIVKHPFNSLGFVESQEVTTTQQGLLDVSLLKNVKLSAIHNLTDGKDHISLQLSGNSLLNINLLNMYVIFQLPPEIAAVMDQDTIRSSYERRILGLIPERGNFSKDEIIVKGSQVYIEISNLIDVNLLPTFEFTLDFDIDYFPSKIRKAYTFYGQTTNYLIDLSILEWNKIGMATIEVPDIIEGELGFHYIPETLIFKNTELPTRTTTIQRQESNWTIEVRDTRINKSTWQVFAQAEPLTFIENPNHQLPNALIYIDEHENKSIISNKAVSIYSGVSKNEEITRIQWREDQGPLLQVSPAEAIAGKYRTTIIWTLVNAP